MDQLEEDCKIAKEEENWLYYISTRCVIHGTKNDMGTFCRNTARCNKCFIR